MAVTGHVVDNPARAPGGVDDAQTFVGRQRRYFSAPQLGEGSGRSTAAPVLPLAISCWSEKAQVWVIGYLHTIKANGSATYMRPNGRLSATVSASGVVEPPSDRPAGQDCFGKTLDQLRAMGRLFEIQPTR